MRVELAKPQPNHDHERHQNAPETGSLSFYYEVEESVVRRYRSPLQPP